MKQWIVLISFVAAAAQVSAQGQPDRVLELLEQLRKGVDEAVEEIRKEVSPPPPPYTRIGAFKDDSSRDFKTRLYLGSENSLDSCYELAKAGGFQYFAVQNGSACWGDDTYSTPPETYGPSPATSFMPCPGNDDQTCGAGWVNEVYATNIAEPPPPPNDFIAETTEELEQAFREGGEWSCKGQIYGNFVVTKKLTLKGAAIATAQRITRDNLALVEACQLLPQDVFRPVVSCDPSGSGSTFTGITFWGGARDRATVQCGTSAATELSQFPRDMTFRANAFRGMNGGHVAMNMNGINFVVTDNATVDYWEVGRDSQGFAIQSGPGPYLIARNDIAGAGENFIVGGDHVRDPAFIPSDITFEDNTVWKPDEWRYSMEPPEPGATVKELCHNGLDDDGDGKTDEVCPTVKNLFELKCAQRVKIRRNLFKNNWRGGQEGSAILFTSRSQYGTDPWCIVEDVLYDQNTLEDSREAYAINILGHNDKLDKPTQQTKRITISRSLFRHSPNFIRVNRGVTELLSVTDNTAPDVTGNLIAFTQLPKTRLQWERNVTTSGAFGIHGDGISGVGPSVIGKPAWDRYVESVSWETAIIGRATNFNCGSAARWPATEGGQCFPPGTTLLEMADFRSKLDPNTFKYLPGGAGY